MHCVRFIYVKRVLEISISITFSTGSNLTMASSSFAVLCPSARTRRGRSGPRQVEAAGKLRLASTILSPWPRLARACSRSGDTMEGIPCSSAALKCTSERKAAVLLGIKFWRVTVDSGGPMTAPYNHRS